MPRAPQGRTQANKRIALADLMNKAPPEPGDATIEALLKAMEPHIAGMIETIGLAAQPKADGSPGDIQAAKIGLDFLARALAGRQDKRGKDILSQIAAIRKQEGAGGEE